MQTQTYLHELWQQALELMRAEIQEVSFNTWIRPLEPVSLDDTTLTLGIYDNFVRNTVESRYAPLIRNAVRHLLARDISLAFVVNSPENKSATPPMRRQEEVVPVSPLNTKYTFDTFVVGNSNRFAHAAALAVAESPARSYNPFFIYGGVGLGKTHLMHAIGNYILSQNPRAQVLYVSSEKFTNELINAIKDDRNEAFRAKYRNIDVLMIDDIQFIAGKERTQEEFFHTFNALYEANKQIILTSDKPPKEIHTLEERLRSRFEWGLIGDIQVPDYETRIAILKKKAQLDCLEVSDDVIIFIADKIASNIRELEGALNRVIAYASLTESTVSIELAAEALKDILMVNKAKIVTSTLIQNCVARYFDLKPDEFQSKKRNREISFPRQIAMYLCRELTDMSLPKIGEEFGGRDHTTVIHACEKIGEEVEQNSETRRAVDEIKRNILGK